MSTQTPEEGESEPPAPTSTHAGETSQDTQRRCLSCGSHVTRQYARTLGDQDNQVHECPDCPGSTQRRRKNGATAGLDVQPRDFDGVVMQ